MAWDRSLRTLRTLAKNRQTRAPKTANARPKDDGISGSTLGTSRFVYATPNVSVGSIRRVPSVRTLPRRFQPTALPFDARFQPRPTSTQPRRRTHHLISNQKERSGQNALQCRVAKANSVQSGFRLGESGS